MSISLKLAVALALAATATMDGCAETRTHEATGQYVDDSVITGKVKAAIAGESSLKVSEINVETFKGVVQLSGFVSQTSDISKAVSVARGVGGRSVGKEFPASEGLAFHTWVPAAAPATGAKSRKE